MIEFLRSRAKAFGYAFSGWWYVIRTQRNAWIHTLISVAVLVVGLWIQLSLQDWIFIIIAFAFVWIAEFLNTALEAVVDLATQENHPLARVGKDVGAAAVLIAALTAIIIGLFVLGPPLLERLRALGF
ncbi:MAG: diacylglycerol kinase family protein [Anaerolineales bacterium]|jgi:diacylglycerol kinase